MVGVLCAINVTVGWYAGYRTVFPYIAFWFLAAVTATGASVVVRRVWPSGVLLDSIRIAIVSLAIILFCCLVAGAVGLLTLVAVAAAESAVCVAVSLATPRSSDSGQNSSIDAESRTIVPPAVAGVVGAIAALAIVYSTTHAPETLYDSLSYHLFFAARWVQDHAVTIVPTPFSDIAQAYAPGNGELFFAWLMLPFHGDVLARVGQLPFACLAATTLYAIATHAGAPAEGAIYPAAFFLLSRPVVEQAVGANVDLICASLFLVAVLFALLAAATNERRDWALLGVAAGLYAGTKYLAIAYLPVLVLVALSRGLRRNALWTLPGLAVFGAPWYVRNWIVAGSPLYPSSLALAGVTVARGAFDRAAMLNTVFHSASPRLLPVIVARAIGPALLLVWVPCALAGALIMLRRPSFTRIVLLLAPAMVLALCWFAVPVNTDSRFLLPAVAPAMLPFAFLFTPRPSSWNRAAHGLLLLGLLWLVVGYRGEVPAAQLPWFMAGWMALDGLVPSPYWLMFGLLAAAIALAWRVRPAAVRWLVPAGVALVAAAAGVVAVASTVQCSGEPCAYLSTTSPHIRPSLVESWQWVDDHVHDATVAYTGINLPYPLTGRQLTNRVIYANIDGRARWRFHDYDRAYRAGRFKPEAPLLASGSGELMPPARGPDGAIDALRPRYERMEGIREAWEFNLETMHARWLFVSALSAYEVDYVWHDDGQFPIERTWAAEDPAMFHLEYQSAGVRIYSIGTGHAA